MAKKKEQIEYYYGDENEVVETRYSNALLTEDAKYKIHHVVKKRVDIFWMFTSYLVLSLSCALGVFVVSLIIVSISNAVGDISILTLTSLFGGCAISMVIHVFNSEKLLMYDDVVVHVIDDNDFVGGDSDVE